MNAPNVRYKYMVLFHLQKNKNKLQLLKAVLNEPEQSANPEELQGKIFLVL